MTFTRRPFLAMSAAFAFGAGAAGAAPDGFLGEWFGALDLGSRQLRLKLEVSAGPKATLYSLDQGGAPIPPGETRIDGDRIFATWPVISARYEGQLTGGKIVGTFRQGGALPLTFARAQETSAKPEPLTQEGLAKLRADAGAPALAAAALSRNGRRIGFVDGRRAVGRGEAVTIADKWHVGSCTKSMTATLVARAVEAGAIGWNDTVGQTLGGAIADMRAEYRDVTYRHLLSHRSGLPANVDIAQLIKFPRESADARADRVAYARSALAQAPAGRKEAHFEYSNSGYVVAGAMLESRLGAPWEMLIADRVFAPLKMAGAGFGAPGTPGAFDQPVGHAATAAGALEPFPPGGPITDNPAVLGPAGRVHAPLAEVLAYLSAHCFRSPFLKPESWQMLHTAPFGGDYALGWERRGDALWHNGSNTLWYCEMMFDPKRGVVSAAAVNDGRIGAMAIPVGKALSGAAAAAV
ncbi:MAG: beta-lactamase family protein [Alphaproteobacteria bacterium]|nr:beta-lactamase family protein [Alphaproteobacteria bacterium]